MAASIKIRLAAGLLILSAAAAQAASADRWARALGLAPNVPLVMPVGAAGPAIGLSERITESSLKQTIGLRGDPGTVGQNAIYVTLSRRGFVRSATQEQLVAEMAERLPGIAMSLQPGFTQNGFGAFGYALGRSGPQICLYAWQSVSNANEWVTGTPPSLFGERLGLSIRVRLCRTRVGAEALVAAVQGLQGGVGSGEVVLSPGGGLDALSAAGAPPGPVLAPMGEAWVPAPTVRRKKRIAPRPEPIQQAPVDKPLPGFPDVPMPR